MRRRLSAGTGGPSGRAFDVVVEDLNKVPVFSPLWAPAPVVLLVHHLFGATAFREASPPVAAATWLLERPLPHLYGDVPTVAVSESTALDLVGRGFDRERIRVIPNGVDVDALGPAADDGRFEQPTLLYLGRLRRYKRVDLPLEALARVRAGGLDARLVIAGKGPHRGALERRVRRMGLEGAVEFRGFVEEEEKAELLRRSWVHVLTSPKEGWGIANLEAAACGTPTVASDSPGLRDSVVDGETGFLVPHGDVEVLGERIGRLLSDGALRTRMADAARRFAEGFTWDVAADDFDEVLRVAAGARSG